MITGQPAQAQIDTDLICTVCGDTFGYGDDVARKYGWQHTKKHGWRCPSHASKSKFNNRKVTLDNHEFHSEAEAVRYSVLKLLQDQGHIRHLELQPKIELQPGFRRNGKWEKPIVYIADFRFIDCATGEIVVEDVKGKATKEYSIKRKLLLYKFPKLDFREVKA